MNTHENTTHPRRDRAPVLLATILSCYLLFGALYAWQTPPWQTPDEPAHFNYIQHVAQENQLPVLQAGDFPFEYLEQIKAARFPPTMSIAPLRYESHQPPLYYVLAAALYRLTAGLPLAARILALRLFSVLLGTAALWVLYRVLHESFPESGFISLAATAFAATVPMHLAMTAAINNDALAELILALLLWQAVRALRGGLDRRRALAMGVLMGLVLLTKTTIYLVAGGAVLMTVLLAARHGPADGQIAERQQKADSREQVPSEEATTSRGGSSAAGVLAQAALRAGGPTGGSLSAKMGFLAVVLAMALILALPFFARNARLYGGLDILGWQRHDSIVAGQLRTADWIAQIGLASFVQRLALTTFRSFWAQFGWMGVLVDERIYLALALWTAMLGAGLAIFLLRLWRRHIEVTANQQRVLLLLGAATIFTLLTYLGYNLKFVQHQGRYLFPALGPLALGAAFGLREVLRPRTARVLAAALLLASVGLLMHGLVAGHVFLWGMLLLAATALAAVAGWLSAGQPWPLAAVLYLAMLALDWICLFHYVVPALRW